MNVFLPIKPKYAFALFDGKKKYEFRKTAFSKEIKRIIVYASSPYKKVIGYFEVKKIHEDHPMTLWKKFNNFAGITEEEFFNYFANSISGISIEVKSIIPFRKHVEPKNIFPNFFVPQSFKYISETEFELLKDSLS